MRILVCGGRDFDDDRLFDHHMNKLMVELGKTSITITGHPELVRVSFISGCDRGVDTFIIQYAKYHGVYCDKYPAEWEKYGKSAGAIRNQEMLDKGRPDLVVAFPGGQGTKHMVMIAKKAGIPVKEI